MESNIIKTATGTIIMNGGNALLGCPADWDEAKALLIKLNEGKKGDEGFSEEPRWGFDCGFKLDFDGPLVSVSSRFYPPKTHYGNTWDGTVSVYLLGNKIAEKKFDCESLDILKLQVEGYVKNITSKISEINLDVST